MSDTLLSEGRPKTRSSSTRRSQEDTPFSVAFANVELPAALNGIANRAMSQTIENFANLRSVSEEVGALVEAAFTSVADYNLKIIQTARAQANSQFAFAEKFINAGNSSDALELFAAHSRQQVRSLFDNGAELMSAAQKITGEMLRQMANAPSRGLDRTA